MTAPYWPRAMKRSTAAAYCDMSVSAFEKEVLSGRFPSPVTIGGREHWCIKALDKAVDHITGQANDSEPDYVREMREKYGPEAA